MHLFHLKKAAALLLSGALMCTLPACHKLTDGEAEEQTTESTLVRQNNPDYVQDDVVLPEDFGNMIYPVEALMVEQYSKGLPYFSGESDEETDSFWFSMAVLTSQMNTYVRDVAVETNEGYIYIDEETTNMYAAAMYDAFARDDIEFPERGEDNRYVTYNAEKGIYGFRQGTIGDLEPYLTECKSDREEYTLTVHLKRKDSVEILSGFEVVIVPNVYESEENAFAYSVKACRQTESGASAEAAEEDTTGEASTEETTTEEISQQEDKSTAEEETSTSAQEDTEEARKETDTQQESSQTSEQSQGSSGEYTISREDAMDLAREYYGDDAQYSYKDTVVIGDYEYYDFSVSGDDVEASDVLISVDGQNVIGGTQNSDGSWSFDQ